jgi:prepilin-type processing-associated H-X9-DG protein
MRRRINFLVGFLMFAVVGAIMLPLIARLRQVEADVQCRNNLRQMGLAVQNSYDTYGRFPLATVRCPSLPPQERLSWYVDLAPFVEQWAMDFDRSKPWDCQENLNPRCHGVEGPVEDLGVIPFFLCPSNPKQSNKIPNLTHYVGISGLGEDAAALDKDYPGVGILGYDRKLKLDDIIDGVSNTMVVAETSRDNGPWTAGGFPTVRGFAINGMPYFGKDAQFCAFHQKSVFSSGPKATNIMFADGSVRSFAETIDPRIFEAMATIAGGESIDLTGAEISR